MNEIDKFRILLPHWIEHNKNHEEEFNKWLAIININNILNNYIYIYFIKLYAVTFLIL